MLSSRTLTPGSPRKPSWRPNVYLATSALTAPALMCLAAATRFTWIAAFCAEMYGSRPDADAVTASGGIADTGTWSKAAICFCRCPMSLTSTGLSGPRLDAPLASGLQPPLWLVADVADADARGWKYCGSGLPLASVNSWQSKPEPTTCPWNLTSDPLACRWNATWLIPNTTAGYKMPQIAVKTSRPRKPARSCRTLEGRRDM